MGKDFVCPICGSDIYDYNEKTKKYVCKCCGEEFSIDKSKDNKSICEASNATNEKKFFDSLMSSVITIHAYHENSISMGTAFFISPEYLLTNAHVVFSDTNVDNACNNIAIQINGSTYGNKHSFVLDVINADFKWDIAILKVQEGSNKYAGFSENMYNGEKVYAIGNSKGFGLCILEGIISDVKRIIDDKEVMMISALVTNGNSGCPVFNSKGRILGMVSMSSSKSLAMNYAIPSKALMEFIKKTEVKEEIKIL